MLLDFLKNRFGDESSKKIADRSPVVFKAYDFANAAHAGQTKNGEPYITHCISTAGSLLNWGLDDATIAAGFLHDVIEDTTFKLEDIEKEFGKEIAGLVDGATHIKAVKYDIEKAEADTLMKMFLAMTKDLRVILIKLASRRHNIQTIGTLNKEDQIKLAKDTMDIHAPIAYRLGMQQLSGELEDASFAYLNPSDYEWLLKNVKERYEEREKYLERIKPAIEEALANEGIKVSSIDFRAKRYWSLYRKLQKYNMDLDKIYDLVAMRVIVEDIRNCYAATGVIHKLWSPLPGRIKDYIALPKPNGYQSIHTTVICDDQKPVEFQVKTREMKEKAENGIAAHWLYDRIKGSKDYVQRKSPFANSRDITLTNQLRSWQSASLKPEELIERLKIDFFDDRIFVLTPKGEVIDLPQGSTPIDFAYSIHEALGNECVGAKVNGKIATFDQKLRSEDVVEIMRQKNKKPSLAWLDFVVTSNAKTHIKKAARGASNLARRLPEKIEMRVEVENKTGLLKAVTDVITRSHINMIGINSLDLGNRFILKIVCDTSDKDKIAKVTGKIRRIDGVRGIEHRLL